MFAKFEQMIYFGQCGRPVVSFLATRTILAASPVVRPVWAAVDDALFELNYASLRGSRKRRSIKKAGKIENNEEEWDLKTKSQKDWVDSPSLRRHSGQRVL